MRKTKIIATVGPASQNIKILKELILAGVDVFRLNFSHGDYSTHQKTIQNIRQVSGEVEKPVAILGDLQGPKIRIGKFSAGKVYLKKGQEFTLIKDRILGNEGKVHLNYPWLFSQSILPRKIFLNDGLIKLKVIERSPHYIKCKVLNSGEISDNKGVNIPGGDNISSLTKKDKEALLFCIKQNVDWVSLSFVQNKDDVLRVKNIISQNHFCLPVISKIEKREGIKNLKEIVKVSDGIMIARGDLGVEMLPDEIPYLQKKIINVSHLHRKLVIVATEMLQSMINSPRPTRAEVSDVAGAVSEGADAVMLSGETAIGSYPVQTVQMMSKIIKRAEKHLDYHRILKEKNPKLVEDITEAIAHSAVEVASDLSAKVIVAATSSGFTAQRISLYKPQQMVLGITPRLNVQRKMSLFWGVHPYLVEKFKSTDEMLSIVEKVVLREKIAKSGDFVVIVGGTPPGEKGKTNFLKVIKI